VDWGVGFVTGDDGSAPSIHNVDAGVVATEAGWVRRLKVYTEACDCTLMSCAFWG